MKILRKLSQLFLSKEDLGAWLGVFLLSRANRDSPGKYQSFWRDFFNLFPMAENLFSWLMKATIFYLVFKIIRRLLALASSGVPSESSTPDQRK